MIDSAGRRYDKGERRFKHVGSSSEPIIEFDNGNPKMWIGKCPSTISELERESLLSDAVPGSNGDRDLGFVKKLYVVHKGAIYEAQTSDHGRSYHGYPYKGKLSGVVLRSLIAMGEQKGCADELANWIRMYIQRHGER